MIILSLKNIISARKAELAERRSEETATVRALTKACSGHDHGENKPSGYCKAMEVVSEIRGEITHKKVTEGSRVNRGDILGVIDKSDYRNSCDSALASYEAALADEERFKALVRKDFVARSRLDAAARVKIARARLLKMQDSI